ncbi:antibiotic biosynthesis monooxygenase [Patulibacter minatonensis]|uniref:antibiotic biosynthesis monooxygenase n=1 Tax=Patulibacter minatonensis TaxID=298163 RepID=UPI00068643A6|nr:antibiotic biosynthesis monooxygenase [Patulibacter minatonensis]
MSSAARHVEFTALAGKGDDLAAVLVEVGESLRGTPGCDSWVVSRVPGEPERIVVDERWATHEIMTAAAEASKDDENLPRVMALLDGDHPPVLTELEPVGGAGLLPAARDGVTHRSLLDTEDQAKAFGFSSQGESRFPGGDLGLERTGVALHRMPADAVSAFGHVHANAEELYVVLSGSGRIRVGDDSFDLSERDGIRVGPELIRGFVAGPDGLEVLAVGPKTPKDGDIVQDWSPVG